MPCGTGGTSCTKSVTLNVGVVDVVETVILDKEKEVSKNQYQKYVIFAFASVLKLSSDDHCLQKILISISISLKITTTGLYVFVIVPTLSISLQWDKGTRVSIQAHPRWKDKVNISPNRYNIVFTLT